MFLVTILSCVNFIVMLWLLSKMNSLRHDLDLHREELRLNRRRLRAAGIPVDVTEDDIQDASSQVRPGSVIPAMPATPKESPQEKTVVSPEAREEVVPVSAPVEQIREESLPDPAPQIRTPHLSSTESQSSVFERLFGRTLPIWAGGLTLAVTGILGVKWSIDAGILSEGVRVMLGAIFGLALIGGAFWQRSGRDSRIPQALSGAGIASLYGSVLSSHLLYGLISPGGALSAMVVVTIAGGALSLLFGAPSALVALAGGLAAPALIGGEGNVPLLAFYVAAVIAGGAFLSRLQDRIWLSLVSLAGGGLWVSVMAFMMDSHFSALFVVMLALFAGFLVPAIGTEARRSPIFRTRPIGAVLATVQCAVLVMMGDYGIVQWAGLFIATLGCMLLGQRKDLAFLPAVAGGIAFFVILFDDSQKGVDTNIIALAFALVHVLHAVWRVISASSRIDAIRLLLVPPACAIVFLMHYGAAEDMALGIVMLACAAFLAGVIEWLRNRDIPTARESEFSRFVAIAIAASGIMLALGEAFHPLALALVSALAISTYGWLRAGLFAIVLTLLNAMVATASWNSAAVASLSGIPFLSESVPPLLAVLRSMGPLLAVSLFAAWSLRKSSRLFSFLPWITAGFAGLVLVHSAWKQVFSIDTGFAFGEYGMAERTAWELILALAACAVFRKSRILSVTLGTASFLHFLYFSLFLHNPVLMYQKVGPAPVANLIGLAFLTGFSLLFAMGRLGVGKDLGIERPRRIVQMSLLALGAFMLLRQAFAGTIVVNHPVSQLEDILRSLVAIGIALGLLVYGMRRSEIDWRIGSLVFMLLAVAKVFVFDAAGLDGLARIGSFAALGFALIGVGWLYARLLPERSPSVSVES